MPVLVSSAPGRLVGEDDLRPGDESAGDRHALLLPARELAGLVTGAVAEADPPGHLAQPLRVGAPLREPERERDVLLGGQRRNEVERLEDEADALAAELAERVLSEPAEISASPRWTVPVVGRSRPAAQWRNVLLPDPEGPITAVKDPRANPNETSRRAATLVSPLPYILLTDESRTLSVDERVRAVWMMRVFMATHVAAGREIRKPADWRFGGRVSGVSRVWPAPGL